MALDSRAQTAPKMENRPADPDGVLVRAVAAGDERAFASLMERHLRRIVSLSWRLLGNTAEAEEVGQEVFLRVWRHAGGWEDDGRAKFLTWMQRVALNLCRDRLRRRREADNEVLEYMPSGAPGPEACMHGQDRAERVQLALATLPERQREALTLCYYQEMGNIEAARVMEVSVEAMESLLARGRRNLRAQLEQEADGLRGEL